jgi:hypothetical protein
MNPFQKAQEAQREAERRRRAGNAARAYNRQSYKNMPKSKPKPKAKPKTPPRYSYARPGPTPKPSAYGRAGPTPRYSARPGPTPRTSRAGPTPRNRRKTRTPIFEENNQGYTYNFEPETPPRRKPETPPFLREYRKALLYFGYGSLAGKTAGNVKKNYFKMALKKHPNKGGNAENFKRLGHYYNILKAELNTKPF